MEKDLLLTDEFKADIDRRLYRIRRITSDLHHVLETHYRAKGDEEFYRFFVRQLDIEVYCLKERFNMEGGVA